MIGEKDYKKRRSEFNDLVNQAGLESFLVGSREGIYYLTGASYVPEERPFFVLFRPGRETVLVVPELERVHMQKAGVGRVVSYGEFPAVKGDGWDDVLLDTAGPVASMGVEPGICLDTLDRIRELSPVKSTILDEMRLVKSPEEIAAISATAVWADRGMAEILNASYAGATVVEIFSTSRSLQARVIRETEYDPVESSFLMASWPAPFSAQPHGIPRVDDRMGAGPLVAISYLRVNGYAAEVERTYFHQAPQSREKEMFHHMMTARKIGISMVRPGVRCHDVDQAVVDYFKSSGVDRYILHRTGHGIGLGNHEGPFLARGSRDTLCENMVVSIEPGLYVPELGGFRHSDTYVVTRDGCRPLTRTADRLEDLVITGKKPFQRLRGLVIRKSLRLDRQ